MISRCAVVLSWCRAVPPPGIDTEAYVTACLTDSYEVVAGMTSIAAGLAGESPTLEDIRWPADLLINDTGESVRRLADRLVGDDLGFAELIILPADVPDLPELIIAKIAKALSRADVALAPELGGIGLAALGVRLPWPSWLDGDLDLGADPYDHLQLSAPHRNLVVRTQGWHRMRTPESVHRLDPSLEGWDNVRLLLSGATHPG